MADTVSKLQRSRIMSAVRSKDTKMEVVFRKVLWQKGFRYRKNSAKYFGKPDIVLKKYKTVIFLDSCFWHGCSKHFRMPSSNNKYWKEKIKRNVERDNEVNMRYKKNGWKVMRIWEHEFKRNRGLSFEKIIRKIKSQI